MCFNLEDAVKGALCRFREETQTKVQATRVAGSATYKRSKVLVFTEPEQTN